MNKIMKDLLTVVPTESCTMLFDLVLRRRRLQSSILRKPLSKLCISSVLNNACPRHFLLKIERRFSLV
jgi:hypothetical protein